MNPRAFAFALWVGSALLAIVLERSRTGGSFGEDNDRRIAAMSETERRTFLVLLVGAFLTLGPVALVLEVHHRFRSWRRRRYAEIVHEWDPELGWIRRELEPDDDDEGEDDV